MSPYKKKRTLIKIISILIIVLVVFFVIYANLKLEDKLHIDSGAIEPKREFPIVLNLEYFGYDSKNLPYKILGEKGFDISDDLKKLTNASAEFTIEGGKLIKVKADVAELNQKTNQLTLLGSSKIENDDGSTLTAPEIQLFYDQKQAFGSGGVKLNNASGSVEAKEFEISDDYNKITFKGGRVKSVIYEEKK